ncbi:MAG: hypothetical protein CTY23_04540 [Methylomonas sp.]|nr:MAG: hypothetical protein CTY23_04540 [Methylomonas sp.]
MSGIFWLPRSPWEPILGEHEIRFFESGLHSFAARGDEERLSPIVLVVFLSWALVYNRRALLNVHFGG